MKIKCQAKNCKEVLTRDNCLLTGYDGEIVIPVMFAKDHKEIGKIYKKFHGDTYYHDTCGNKIKDDFYKTEGECTHHDLEDVGIEIGEHTFGNLEIWINF